ncbi:MAG: hypothetical protein ACRDD7_08270 [Peptostreptococcaceae bacterium]
MRDKLKEIDNRIDNIDTEVQDRIINNLEKLNNKLEGLIGGDNE